MSPPLARPETSGPLLETHLLGRVDFDLCTALMRRLAWDVGERGDGRMVLLLCEHPPLITVGRGGSRGHIRLSGSELARRALEVRWVSRGGGCVLHAPGQLAIYPVVWLAGRGWSVEQYLERLRGGLSAVLAQLGIHAQSRPGSFGLWGRTGQLAALGVAVENWVTRFGAYLNVNPAPGAYGFVDTAESADGLGPAAGRATMSSLVGERGRPAAMAAVRALVVEHLATALGCGRFHLHTGHPLLAQLAATRPEATLRAS